MSKASTTRHSTNAAMEAWAEACALKHREPRVVEVPARYWLAALPAIILCVGLLLAFPNPQVM